MTTRRPAAFADDDVLVGRDDELERVQQLLAGLAHDGSFALVVAADAGMGKSALLDRIAVRTDVTVLRASGVSSEAEITFSGLHELLAPILDQAAFLPERPRTALHRSLGLESGAADKMASFVAVPMLLAAAAEEVPVLCLVDDVHWLDESSVDALLFAARRHPARVGFVFAVRADEDSRLDASWLPWLRLGPLDEAASRAVLDHAASGMSTVDADRVIRAADGCPLALIEFARGVLRGEAGPVGTPPRMGTALEASFGAAVLALPEPARRALVLLAAAETDTRERVAAAVAAFTGQPNALDPAVDAGLVVATATGLRFRHPLVRSAAYHSATRAAQRDAHRLLADAFDGGEPERAAWHRAAAADEPDEAVASALVRSAHEARRRGGYAAESRALERAAVLTPDPATSIARLAAAATAALQAGKNQHAEQLLHRVVRHADDPIVLADAEHELAQITFWQSGRRLPSVAAVAERVAPVDPGRAARLLSYDLVSLISDYQADAALPIALRARVLIGDAIESSDVGFRVAHVLIMAGRTADGAALTARVARAAVERHDATAAVNIAQPCIWLEEYAQARALLDQATAWLRSVDALWMLGHALVARAELDRRVGDLAGARLAASEALALSEQLAEPMQEAEALAQLAAVDADLGRPVECVAHAQRVARLADTRECGKGELVCLSGAALGTLALGAGRPADAVGHLEGPVRRVLAGGVADPAVFPWVVDLVEAYAQTGRVDDARDVRHWLATHAMECGRGWARRAVLRCDVVLDDSDESRERLAASLAQEPAVEQLQTARGWLTLGASRRRAGQRTLAREALQTAHVLFDAIGANGWAELTAAELRALGARATRAPRDPLTSLTPQEARVAQLVAGGARNREVAASLFVTTKTVETHLAAIYRKLGVRSRAELTGLLARLPEGD